MSALLECNAKSMLILIIIVRRDAGWIVIICMSCNHLKFMTFWFHWLMAHFGIGYWYCNTLSSWLSRMIWGTSTLNMRPNFQLTNVNRISSRLRQLPSHRWMSAGSMCFFATSFPNTENITKYWERQSKTDKLWENVRVLHFLFTYLMVFDMRVFSVPSVKRGLGTCVYLCLLLLLEVGTTWILPTF